MNIVSFGGGKNSTALIIGLQERGERPDHILFADTGGEHQWTYDHIAKMQFWLEAAEFPPITIVRESITLEQDCLDRETLPGKAFGFGSCSEHFKIRPQQRWLKEQGLTDVTWMVGFHAREKSRIWPGAKTGQSIRYPLIEWGWGEYDCIMAIERAGFNPVKKSACFYCPSNRKPEVLKIAKYEPDKFARAVEMERNAAPNMETVKGLGRRYSWEKLAKADAAQVRLFPDDPPEICGMCFDGE